MTQRTDPEEATLFPESETPPDVEDISGLPAQVQRAMDRPAGFDAEGALAEFNYRERTMAKLRPACLTVIRPKDFIVMGALDNPEATAYLQDTGAQRIKPLLGIVYPSEPVEERHELGDGHFAYIYRGWVVSRSARTADYVIGGRSSKDKFFEQKDEEGNPLPIDPLDVQKAAYSNFECRAVSGIAGLRGLCVDDLRQMGFKVDQCRTVKFQSGGKGGGGATVAPRFGDTFKEFWGKPWSELPDKALGFYLQCAKRTLGDDSKKRFHDLESRRVQAITAEIHQRQQGAKK